LDAVVGSRERLLEAALDSFFAGTFHSVGVAEISRVAGVNKATLYHFFASKNELFAAVLDNYTANVVADFMPIVAQAKDPAERLQDVFNRAKWHNTRYKEAKGYCPGCMLCTMASEFGGLDPELQVKGASMLRAITVLFEPIIEDLLVAHRVRGGDAGKGAAALMSLLIGAQSLTKLYNDPSAFDTLASTSVRVVLAAAAQQVAA
jgi:TetR/AcrR family transcriptional regulator, transcriptional repressor for nem operon